MALGPLTNVAIALLADPGLGARLQSLYIMGGNMEGVGNVTAAAEFNFHADPEAAAAVLRLARCPTTIATWELSYKYTFVPLRCTVLYCTVLYCTVLQVHLRAPALEEGGAGQPRHTPGQAHQQAGGGEQCTFKQRSTRRFVITKKPGRI